MSKQHLTLIGRALFARRRGWAGLPLLLPSIVMAGPTGGEVVDGTADISTPDSSTTQIDQATASAIINWQTFSVGADEFVIFNQPSASSVVLNRVIGGSMSEILGNLQANGRVFLVNPMGVLFGESARIDVGGLMATTMDISNTDFMAGNYVFAGDSTAALENRGVLSANNGFVVLSADQVRNTGLIEAIGGNVVLASASGLTLDLDGAGLVGYSIDQAALSELAGIENFGDIVASGGAVVLHADVARQLAGTVVNNQGQISARGIAEGPGGDIFLTASGGDIVHNGVIDASGSRGGVVRLVASDDLTTTTQSVTDASGTQPLSGGFIELSGHQNIRLGNLGNAGQGGRLRIDPRDLIIADGSGQANSNMVFEQDIENQMRAGVDVFLDASNSITVQSLVTDGAIDGRNNGDGASLFLGISTSSYGGSFIRGSGGAISFDDVSNSIFGDSNIDILGGSVSGTLNLGNLAAENITLDAGGAISAQALGTSGGTVTVRGAGGDINIGAIAANHQGPNTRSINIDLDNTGSGDIAVGSLVIDSAASSSETSNVALFEVTTANGDISLGNFSADVSNNDGDASLTANFNTTGGDIRLQDVAASVEAAGFAGANLSLSTSLGSILGGNINLDATAGGDGSVSVSAFAGTGSYGGGSGSGITLDDVTATATGDGAQGTFARVDLSAGGSGSVDALDVLIQATNTGSGRASAEGFFSSTGSGNIIVDNVNSIAVANSGRAETSVDFFSSFGSLVAQDLNLQADTVSGAEGLANLSVRINGQVEIGDVDVAATAVGGYAEAIADFDISNGNVSIGDIVITANAPVPGLDVNPTGAYALLDFDLNGIGGSGGSDVLISSINVSSTLTQGGSVADSEAFVDIFNSQGAVRIGSFDEQENFVAGDVVATATTSGGSEAEASIDIQTNNGEIRARDVTASATATGNSDDVYAQIDLDVNGDGDITVRNVTSMVTGTGNDDASAYAYLFADNGNITADTISVMATADGTDYVYGSASIGTRNQGAIDIGQISVNVNNLGANSGASGYLSVETANGSLSVGDATLAIRAAAEETYVYGYASFDARGSGSVTVGDVNVSAIASNGGSGSAYIYGYAFNGGDINFGNLSTTVDVGGARRGYSSINLYNSSGDINTADISIDVEAGSAFLFANANGGNLTVDGSINVVGGGGLSSFDFTEGGSFDLVQSAVIRANNHLGQDGTVSVFLEAENTVNVTEGITVLSEASTFRQTFSDSFFEQISGNARVGIEAGFVEVGADGINITGVGEAGLEIDADATVNISGQTNVTAGAGQITDQFGGNSRLFRGGTAYVSVRTTQNFGGTSGSYGGQFAANGVVHSGPTTIDMGAIRVTGPSAYADLESNQINVNGGTGNAIQISALNNGVDGSGAYQQSDSSYGGNFESSFAFAGLSLRADGPGDDSLSITTTGGITVSGPSAGVQIETFGDISIGGDILISGTGYEVSGDGDFRGSSYGGSYGGGSFEQIPFDLQPPYLDSGRVRWGAGGLRISGLQFRGTDFGGGDFIGSEQAFDRPPQQELFFSNGAGNVSLGNVSVSGVGLALVDIEADTLSAGNITADAASQGAGEIQGEFTEFNVFISDESGSGSYDVQHVISDGNDGAALYGLAELRVMLSEAGSADIGNVQISGTTGYAEFDGVDSDISVGNISVNNSLNAIWDDQQSFTPLGQAPARGPASTSVSGDISVVSAGFDAEDEGFGSLASFSAGNISVIGGGTVIAALSAGSVDTGIITLSPGSGSFVSDSPLQPGAPDDYTLDEAILTVSSTGESNPSIAGVLISGASNAYLDLGGVQVSGNVSVTASNEIFQATLPDRILSYTHPVEVQRFGNDDGDENNAPLFSILDINAGGTISLVAPNLNIDGASLNGNAVSISTDSLSLQEVLLSGGAITLTNNSGDLQLLASNIDGSSTIITSSTGVLLIEDTSINDPDSSTPTGTVNISGADIDIVDSHIGGNSVTVSAADDLNVFNNNTLLHGTTLSLNAGDSLDFLDGFAAGNNISFSAGGSLVLEFANVGRGEQLSANSITMNAGDIDIFESTLLTNAWTATASGNLSAQGSTLRGGTSNLSADEIFLSGNTQFATTLVANASDDLSMEGDILIGDTLTLTGQRVTLSDEAQVSGRVATTLTATGGNVFIDNSSIFATETGPQAVTLQASNAILLQNATIQGGIVQLLAPTAGSTGPTSRALTTGDFEGPAGRIIADEATVIDALGLGMRAGTSIDMSRAELRVGSASAGLGADTRLLQLLGAANAALLPVSTSPNAAFIAPQVSLGQLGMAGDYLFVQANNLAFNGPIDAPSNLFFNLRPLDNAASVGLEASEAGLRNVNYNAEDHIFGSSARTVAFGGSNYGGLISIGENGPVNLGEFAGGLVFLANQPVQGGDRITPAGAVTLLGGAVVGGNAPDDTVQPQVQQFRPDQGGELGSGDDSDDDERRGNRDDGNGPTQLAGARRYIEEQNNVEAVLECQ